MQNNQQVQVQIQAMEKLVEKLNVLLNKDNNDSINNLAKSEEELKNFLSIHGASHIDDIISIEENVQDERYDRNRRTLLHCACNIGNLKLVKFIHSHGADIKKQTRKGQEALNIAARSQSDCADVVEFLIDSGANLEALSRWRFGPEREPNLTALHAAIGYLNVEVFKILIARGANKEAATASSTTGFETEVTLCHRPIHMIICRNHGTEDLRKKQLEMLQYLLNSEVNIEAETRYSINGAPPIRATPLKLCQIMSIYTKHDDMNHWHKMKNALIEKGANRSVLEEKDYLLTSKLDHAESRLDAIDQKLKQGLTKKVASCFEFWVAFSVPKEIIQVLLSFESVSKFLINKHFDLSDKKTRFCFCLCVAVAICTIVCLYNRDCLPNSELKNYKINNGLDVDNLGL